MGYYPHCIKSVKSTINRTGGDDTPPVRFINLLEMLYIPHSFFKELLLANLAAFFSLRISFFCLFDLGGAFCTFFCSLFATVQTLLINTLLDQLRYYYCIRFAQEDIA